MKREFFVKNSFWQIAGKWGLSFLISSVLFMLLILAVTLLQKLNQLSENILRLVLVIIISLCSGFCAYIFRRMTDVKGLYCGLATAAIISLIKLILSALSGGINKENIMVYICIMCVSLIGGIVSANKQNKKERELGKINKSAFLK